MRGDRHPLALILGRQSGVRSRLLPFGADYLEFILALPFVAPRVSRERGAGAFCYPRTALPRPRLANPGGAAALCLRQTPRRDPDDRGQL